MKVLFVCRANIVRSQIAEVFFNKLSKESKAISAGTKAVINFSFAEKNSWPDGSLQFISDSMKEYGYDLSSQRSKQLTKEMVEEVDKVIVMCEKDDWPDFLKTSSKVEYWDIEDGRGKPLEKTKEIIEQIRRKVKGLIEGVG